MFGNVGSFPYLYPLNEWKNKKSENIYEKQVYPMDGLGVDSCVRTGRCCRKLTS